MEAKKVRVPTAIEIDEDSTAPHVEYKEKTFEQDLDWRTAFKACEEVTRNKIRSKESFFRLSVHPNSSINVHGIRSILQQWDREGFTADVVIIDYADILAPPSGVADTRDQINATWKALRSLSQARHCLVITATQTDAASYDVATISRKNFSEDKRKRAHVTGTFGLNQTATEKELGITRLNWIVLREGRFSESKCVYVAGSLDIANPAIISTW